MRDGGLLGWCTEALVKLDDAAPGVLARVLTAAPARRQAIFAALASREEQVGLCDAGDDLIPMASAPLTLTSQWRSIALTRSKRLWLVRVDRRLPRQAFPASVG